MTARRTYIPDEFRSVGLLIAALSVVMMLAVIPCLADSQSDNELTIAQYRAELDQLLVAAHALDSSGHPIPTILKELPPNWRIRTGQQDFDVTTDGLRHDVSEFEQEKDVASATAIESRIQALRNDIDGFETSPPDVSSSRAHLNSLLARPEFRDVHGPTFIDRLAQKVVATLIKLLERLFRSSAIPAISKFFVYGLIGLAVLALAFLAYRYIKSAGARENVVPTDLPVSAKNWALWLADSRAAAAQSNWRDAIHLAYWAGISFLEHKGEWRPDRARTPREYLRLLSISSEHRETLATLTRVFELAWYARRDADAAAFAQTIQALEELGCH
jgi:hypothetical protein